MDQLHGVDVSWMTHGSPRDKPSKPTARKRAASSQSGRDTPPTSPEPESRDQSNGSHLGTDQTTFATHNENGSAASAPRPTTPSRPGFSRTESSEKKGQLGQSPNMPRRSSWLQSISSKFSSSGSPQGQQSPNNATLPKQAEPAVPIITPNKNAVLARANKPAGDAPYTPAPPKGGQGGIMHVFRRLSSANGTGTPTTGVRENHGLVERRVLNVDQHRERCKISELNQAKLRRVAFCVDVEIAPMPKYAEAGAGEARSMGDKTSRRKMSEKGEGAALKNPKAVEDQKETTGTVEASGELRPKEPEKEGIGGDVVPEKLEFDQTVTEVPATDDKVASDAKKKDKKKRTEEERKARKEKKRKLAEENGSIPIELHLDSDSSSPGTPGSGPVKPQTAPTVNPVRIYRRCCQLREGAVLKKITTQLLDPNNSTAAGLVDRLDLTDYSLELADAVALGDFFAVVPVKEVNLSGCGLLDEGVRVILAGLLAAKVGGPSHRRPVSGPDGLVEQGGVVEKVVLSNNKLGPEGWRHIALFIYLCRSLKSLDVSKIPFPQRPQSRSGANPDQKEAKRASLCNLLYQSLGQRLAGSRLETLSISDAGLTNDQLGVLIDGAIQCGLKNLGVANNDIDDGALQHVLRYLRPGFCQMLDISGFDMREHMHELAEAIALDSGLKALSLRDTNLRPGSLCKLLPTLARLSDFRYLDISGNPDLFRLEPNALPVLRRYLPKFPELRRIDLVNCGIIPEQAIAIAEMIPDLPHIAAVSLLENPELAKLANAQTEAQQEEAISVYASLLAAARISTTLITLDLEVPTEKAGELVKAMAKQIVAYGLRNIERVPASDIGLTTPGLPASPPPTSDPAYPDVIQHIVGHDVMEPDSAEDAEQAPDEDYIIGGTGVVKALTTCLKNRGDESRRESGDFNQEIDSGIVVPRSSLPGGKAKDMSNHLLIAARKIRSRIQPALAKQRASEHADTAISMRLAFLARTLDGIIGRFEAEFPDSRELLLSPAASPEPPHDIFSPAGAHPAAEIELPAELEQEILDADDAEDTAARTTNLKRHDSLKDLAQAEGRALRAGHRFRVGVVRPEHYGILAGLEEIGADPTHSRILYEILDELGDQRLIKLAKEEGPVKTYTENRDRVLQLFRETDPEHWRLFAESMEKATTNVKPRRESEEGSSVGSAVADPTDVRGGLEHVAADEVAVVDD